MDANSPSLSSGVSASAAGESAAIPLGSGPALELIQAGYNALIAHLPQGVFVKNRESQIIAVNAAMVALLGLKAEEIIGKTDEDLFRKEMAEKYRADDLRVMSQGRAEKIEETLISQGKTRHVEVVKSPIYNQTGEVSGLIGMITDVTENKRAFRWLRRSEEEFRRVWENCLDGMRLTDEDGIIVRVNPAFCRLVGKSESELVGQTFTVIYEATPSEAMVGKHRKRFADRDVEQLFERELSLWNGTKVWFELSNSFIEVEGQKPHLLSIFRDISERKHNEEKVKEFNARLERSNRELQDFAYVASHDLQEPLRKVSVFGDRLKAKYGAALGTEGCDYLDRMQKAAQRMQILIQDLLTFSRVTSKSQPFVPVDLNKVASEVIGDLESRIEQVGGEVQVGALPTIEAEPLHMRQLLQNLIGNALKFHRPDVKPLVRVDAYTFKEHHALAETGTREMVQLTVSDNGIGFDDQKYLEKIFQVFQRLHSRAQYEGTGMGLAITRKIVEHHGGQITAKSKSGEGATFIVILPVHQLSSTQNL